MSSITMVILEILLVIAATSVTLCIMALSVLWAIDIVNDYGLLEILFKERDGE